MPNDVTSNNADTMNRASQPDDAPLISIIIACKNVARYIDDALWSARRQTIRDIEILVIDDASADSTVEHIQKHAAEDSRLRLFKARDAGPAAARNIGLMAARGKWIAVLDGDDIMHPRRFENILTSKAVATADIIAENQIQFYEDGSQSRYLIDGGDWLEERQIDLVTYIDGNEMFAKRSQLGYLKPLIRRDRLAEAGIFYDEKLRIGEDYDLIARALLAGFRFTYLPTAFYFYRRHNSSMSFRLTTQDLALLRTAAKNFHEALPSSAQLVREASFRRQRSLMRAWRFADLVDRLKSRQIGGALRQIVAYPNLLPMLWEAFIGGIRRRLREGRQPMAAQVSSIPSRKTCVLLWRGEIAEAKPVLACLEARGWQVKLYPCDEHEGNIKSSKLTKTLLDLSSARDSNAILCNDPRLIDYLPYLLSPQAKIGLISSSNPKITEDQLSAFDFRMTFDGARLTGVAEIGRSPFPASR